ncbi:type II toxin-antitoxin system RelE family toxin [Rhodanobacter terrae]|uniref:Type II toxin-antitoxin system RelE/ParE family toxin n=1 Tax=Rhodanobacter terrae TaxID=418647 RepID=A0ABW0T1W5_9GAMM
MTWRIELSSLAQKNIRQFDPQTRQRILKFLSTRVAPLDDPRSLGEALKGSKLGDFWKYRVGDYRIIADIQDGALCILVVRIGNRREVYR